MARKPDLGASSGEMGSRKTPSFWYATVSPPLAHLTPLKQATGTQESTLSFPQAYILHTNAGLCIVLTEMFPNRGLPFLTTQSLAFMSRFLEDFRRFTLELVCALRWSKTRELAQDGQQVEGF